MTSLRSKLLAIEQILTILAGTPPRIAALSAGLARHERSHVKQIERIANTLHR